MTFVARFRSGFVEAARAMLGDSQVRATALIAPLLLALLSPTPYLGRVANDIPIALVDLDRSEASRQLTRLIEASEKARVVNAMSLETAKDAFFRRQVFGAVLIPNEFERALYRGETASIATYTDASYFLLNRDVSSAIVDTANAASRDISAYRLQGAGLSSAQAAAILAPLEISTTALFNPSGNYAVYQVPAILVLIVQMSFLSGIGAAFGARREENNPIALRGLPGLAGSAIAFAVFGVLVTSVLLTLMPHWYGYSHRADLVTLAAIAVPFMLATSLLGLVLAAFFRTREAPTLALIYLSIPVFMLAGYAWPVDAMPETLRHVASALPSTAAIDAFVRVDQMGASLQHVRERIGWLWLLAATYGVIAYAVHRAGDWRLRTNDTLRAVR